MFCSTEQKILPDDQFKYYRKWGWVHETASPRHTVTGTDIEQTETERTRGVAPENMPEEP